MQQGETAREPSLPLDPMESPRPQSSRSTLTDADAPTIAPDDSDTTDTETIPVGVLVQKSCVHEKTKTGFFQRLVGSKAQKYHVSMTSLDDDDSSSSGLGLLPITSPDSLPRRQMQRADSLDDIPLNPTGDLNVQLGQKQEDVVPQVVIHESPQKPLPEETTTVGYKHPILHKQSISTLESASSTSSSSNGSSTEILVLLTIVSASNLLKVHKFGVQAPYVEMRISSDEMPFRTTECKKGGTEAQWNQTFTRRVQSLDDTLHLAAKASTTVIGDALVSFRSLELTTALSNHTLQLARGKSAEAVGTVCLQCRLLDPTASSTNTAAATATGALSGGEGATPCPVAPLPIPSAVDKPVEPKVSVAKVKYNHINSTDGNVVPWDAAIRKGALLYKIPYHQSSTAPKRKWVAVQELPKQGGLCITWSDPQNPDHTGHAMPLHDVVEVKTGIKTQAFRKQHAAQSKANTFFHEDVCFSLNSASRSLDLAASSKEEAQIWVTSLRRMLQHQTATTSTTTKAENAAGSTTILTSAKIMKDFKTAATTSTSSVNGDKANRHATWLKEFFRCAKAQQLSEIANYLLEGCPVDLLEPQTGDTILFLACRSGHVALLELCLKWGAKNDPHPTFGDTALQIAVKASQPECVRQLLSIAAKSDMDTEIVNHVDHANQAPLHVAASQGDLVCLQLLLHHGADICVVQSNGHTPLHCAVLAGHESCVAYILDVGGDAIINTGDVNGNTPLHCAVSIGHEGIVKLLLESAADVTVCNNENLTPYKMARRTKARAIQALLAIYEPEPPTPSKDAMKLMHTQSARLQVRDALAKQMHIAASPAKSLSARSCSTTFDGDFDGYTSSSSTSTSHGDNTISASSTSYYHDYHHSHAPPYYPQHHAHASASAAASYVPPSQHYPTYAYPTAPVANTEWEVKYTTDGHAYYVNLYTGVSQWEVPPALQGYDPYAYSIPTPQPSYEASVPAAPVYDSSSQYIRAQLAAARSQQTTQTSHLSVHTPTATAPQHLNVSTPSSAAASPSSSPRSKTSFSERRRMEGLLVENLQVVTTPLPEPGSNVKLDKVNDDGDIFQKSRSRSPKGKSKTVKVLDIKRANNVVMTLSDFEFNSHFEKITQAIVDMDETSLNLERVRCLKGLFPTDDEKDNLLARQADKGEFGKAEKFMMMLEDKKQKVMWEEDKYTLLLHAGFTSGDIPRAQFERLQQLNSIPDMTWLQRSEMQDMLDSLINGCRSCQNLLSHTKNKLKGWNDGVAMSTQAMSDFEKFIKASVAQVNDASEEFRMAKSWESKLVSEFGVVLEEFSPHEVYCAVKQLF
ncbi:unnamed protein product [Aphanomyces euteiches]